MKKILFVIAALVCFSSCVEKKKEKPEMEPAAEEKMDSTTVRKMEPIAMDIDGSYFKATGTEPL